MAPAQAGKEIRALSLRAGQLPFFFFFFFAAPATTVLPAKCWTLNKDNQLYLPAQLARSTFYQLISVSHATVRTMSGRRAVLV